MTSKGKDIVRKMLENPEMPLALFQEWFGVNSDIIKKHCGMSWSKLREDLGLPKLKSNTGQKRKYRK